MKVTEINLELLNSISHVNNAIQYLLGSEEAYQDYKYKERLQKSVDLVSEYVSCFGSDGRVSQRGQVPSFWNKNTIFETDAVPVADTSGWGNFILEMGNNPAIMMVIKQAITIKIAEPADALGSWVSSVCDYGVGIVDQSRCLQCVSRT